MINESVLVLFFLIRWKSIDIRIDLSAFFLNDLLPFLLAETDGEFFAFLQRVALAFVDL